MLRRRPGVAVRITAFNPAGVRLPRSGRSFLHKDLEYIAEKLKRGSRRLLRLRAKP